MHWVKEPHSHSIHRSDWARVWALMMSDSPVSESGLQEVKVSQQVCFMGYLDITNHERLILTLRSSSLCPGWWSSLVQTRSIQLPADQRFGRHPIWKSFASRRIPLGYVKDVPRSTSSLLRASYKIHTRCPYADRHGCKCSLRSTHVPSRNPSFSRFSSCPHLLSIL